MPNLFPRNRDFLLLFILAAIVRFPFIFEGYGVEEDSWGHVLNLFEMKQSGQYILSRLPGHPLYEGLLLLLYPLKAPWLFNGLSALSGVFATLVFYKILVKHNTTQPFWWALSFSWVPVFVISGTYTIDYSIALLVFLLSYYQLIQGRYYIAAILLAASAGFRITQLAFGLPFFIYLLQQKEVRKAVLFSLIAIGATLIFFSPAWLSYGLEFFNFHRPPYPNLLEALYKQSIGVFGVLGSLGLFFWLPNAAKTNWKDPKIFIWAIGILLLLVSYWRMPEKAGFIIPILPFLFLIISRAPFNRWSKLLISGMIVSSFAFGINIQHPLTGSQPSKAAYFFESSNGKTFIDPFRGPVMLDYSKRKTKARAVKKYVEELNNLKDPTFVIAGWWYAMLAEAQIQGNLKKELRLAYYSNSKTIEEWRQKGYAIRFLDDQEKVNNQKYPGSLTERNSNLLSIQ